jgi:hypothetical protein
MSFVDFKQALQGSIDAGWQPPIQGRARADPAEMSRWMRLGL